MSTILSSLSHVSMRGQTIDATPHPVAKMPRDRRPTRRPEKEHVEHAENTMDTVSKMGMTLIAPDSPLEPRDESKDYVSQRAYAKLVSKLSEMENHVSQLSEQNRRQVHEIETLRGSNNGFAEGTGNLRSRVDQLQEQLSRCEVQMTQCIDQRDHWRESYEAEIRAKQEEAQIRGRLKAENRILKNDQGQWTRLFQMANFRQESETEVVFRLQKKCSKLENAYESLAQRYDEREQAFQNHLRKVNSNMDELTAHCSSLAKQSGLRRTYAPIEDESEVVDLFKRLNVAVRYFCLNVWELKADDEEILFGVFPLARKDDVNFATDDVWVLIACVWEWLMKGVFGVGNREARVFDLWLEDDLANALTDLETRIAEVQKTDIIHEWRSFTVQCLYQESWTEHSTRMDDVISEIMAWLLSTLKREDVESEAIQILVVELKNEVVKPAIEFAATLRKRYCPIIIGTTMTVDSAVRKWTKSRLTIGDEPEDLEIVIVPELRKLDLEAIPGDAPYQVIAPAQTYTIVSKQDSDVSLMKSGKDDEARETEQ